MIAGSRDLRVFNNFISEHLTYGSLRVERKIEGLGSVSATLSRFKQDDARFPSATGRERRDILDIRFAGATDVFDWDLEAMG